jgi:hypothetical protein
MNKRILLFLGLLTLTAPAQQPEVIVTTEFLTIALDEPVEGLFFNNGKEIGVFQANLTGLGQPLAYKGPRRMVLRTSEAEFAAKPPLPAPAAVVELPLNANRVLLACLKSADQPLRIIAYDISTAGSRAGDYRFFNFSSKTLSIILGEERFALESRKDKIVSRQSWRDEILDLTMQVATVENNKPRLVYSSIWGHRPGRRNFIFMFDGRHPSKPIGINRFFDIPPSAANPAAKP